MRIDEFDVLRIVAALAVVYIHVTSKAAFSTPRESAYFLSNRLAAFAVPAFIAISAGLAWGAPDRHSGHGHVYYLSRRLRVLVPPYVFWTTVYVALGWFMLKPPMGAIAAVWQYVVALLSGTGWYHLYFVPLAIILYVMSPAARWVMVRSPLALLAVCVAVALACSVLIRPWPVPGSVGDTFARGALLLPYAALGAWYVHDRERAMGMLSRAWLPLLVGGFGARLYLAGWVSLGKVSFDAVSMIVMSAELAGLVGACSALHAASPRVTSRLERDLVPLTYGVFLIHPIVLVSFFGLLTALGWPRMWFQPAFTLVIYVPAVLACFGLVWLLRANPVTKRVT